MSKTFNQVKLNVNFTAISPSSNMSNIESDDNISETFAKIHHWYVKTNGFQASSSPLVSTSNDGIVTTLPSTTGGFLKNTGTAGGAWTTLGDSDIPNTIVRKTGNNTLSGLFEPTSNNGANLGSSNYRFQNIYGTHLFGTDFNGFTIGKSVPSDAVFTDTIPYINSITGPNTGNGISSISFNDDGAVDIQKATFLTEHPTITTQTDTTSTASPSHSGTFTVVDGVTRDMNGHVTKINTKTVTLPTLPTASTSTAGIVKLSSSTSSTSTSLAATPSAVKTAYDVGKSAKDYIDFENMVEIVNTTPYTWHSDDHSQITISMRFTANVIQDGATITDMGILINRRHDPMDSDGSPMPMALTLENYEIDHAQYATEDDGASIIKYTISNGSATNNRITDSGKTATIGVAAIDKFGCGVHARTFVIFTYNGTTYTKYGSVEYNSYRTSYPMQHSTNSGNYFALAIGSQFQSTAPTSDTTWPDYNFYPLYHNPKLYCKPSTGTIYASEFVSSAFKIPSSTYTGTLASASLSANRTWTLPDKTGTIALTSDIPAITATTSSSGSGNAVTAVSLSNGTLTVTKGSTFSLSTHTHSYIPLSGSSSITGNLIPSTSATCTLGTSSKLWHSSYTANMNTTNAVVSTSITGDAILKTITLSTVTNFTNISYKAFIVLGKFVYIDLDATATTNITSSAAGSSLAIAKITSYSSSTYKIFNTASTVGVAYCNSITTPLNAWINSSGEIRVNPRSTAITSGAVIKFKTMYVISG